MKRGFAVFLALGLVLGAVGCTSSSGTHMQSPAPSTPSSSMSPSSPSVSSTSSPSSSDPRPSDGKAAAAAYTAFALAAKYAERKPSDLARRKALAAHAIEPALTNEAGSLVSYAANNIVWAGTPPTPRVRVITVLPASKPYPTVTLRDCPTAAPTWKPYDSKTHKVVPVQFPGSKAPPPHAVTVTVVYYKSRWMVQKTVTQVTKTCAP